MTTLFKSSGRKATSSTFVRVTVLPDSRHAGEAGDQRTSQRVLRDTQRLAMPTVRTSAAGDSTEGAAL
jgi:hypothetical protein